MGFHGSIGSLLLILVIAVLLFGTKKLRHIGEDLGAAVKSFRKGMQDKEETIETDREPRA
jgi:sec-independent protein translocase protein TatA